MAVWSHTENIFKTQNFNFIILFRKEILFMEEFCLGAMMVAKLITNCQYLTTTNRTALIFFVLRLYALLSSAHRFLQDLELDIKMGIEGRFNIWLHSCSFNGLVHYCSEWGPIFSLLFRSTKFYLQSIHKVDGAMLCNNVPKALGISTIPNIRPDAPFYIVIHYITPNPS